MAIDDKIRDCHMILTEKQQKYQHYQLEKLMNTNIFQGKQYCFLMKEK